MRSGLPPVVVLRKHILGTVQRCVPIFLLAEDDGVEQTGEIVGIRKKVRLCLDEFAEHIEIVDVTEQINELAGRFVLRLHCRRPQGAEKSVIGAVVLRPFAQCMEGFRRGFVVTGGNCFLRSADGFSPAFGDQSRIPALTAVELDCVERGDGLPKHAGYFR